MKNIIFNICLLMCFAWLQGVGDAATWYVSNTLGGADNGSQSDPWDTITDALTNMVDGDTVYIHASGTPYRETFSNQNMFTSTFYCDWTGSGTTRGATKAKIWGSTDFTAASWSNVSGNVYKTDYDAETASSELEDVGAGAWAVWHIEGDDITIVKGNDPYNSSNIGTDEFFYDATNDELYINIGADPTAEHIEVLTRNKAMEVWKYTTILNGVFQFANYGNLNGSCHCFDLRGCEYSYNALYGFATATTLLFSPTCEITYLSQVSINHNGSGGVLADLSTTHFQVDNALIYANGGDGIHLECMSEALGGDNNYIYHCTIVDNDGYGVGIYRHSPTNGNNAVVYNVISEDNALGAFYAEDLDEVTIDADYNCTTGSYSGKWSQGGNDTGSDPDFIDSSGDYLIKAASPCRDGGIGRGVLTDRNGRLRPMGIAPDIGCYEMGGSIDCSFQ